MLVAQIIMVLTLLVMIAGFAPLYMTAVIGTSLAALAAGFTLIGTDANSITKLLQAGLHPVIIDMLGVLLFIGIMEKAGYLHVIVVKIMEIGRKVGGGPGVATAAGLAASFIGALTSFTQPVITATIGGPAAVRLGLEPNKTSAIISHAAHLANMAGFTHPTMLAILAVTGVKFGMINVLGAIGGLSIYAFSYYRAKNAMIAEGLEIKTEDVGYEAEKLPEDAPSFGKAIFPFLLLCIGFLAGMPVFLVGVICSIMIAIMAKMDLATGEKSMISGVANIAIPLVAIISLLFMSSVINKIGLVSLVADVLAPYLKFAPIQILLIVSAVAGTITQSNAASAALVVPFLQVVLQTGADPFAASFAGISGAAVMQFYLTGGPLTSLPVVAAVIPGTDQKIANKFQRPSMLVGLLVCFVITLFL